MKIGELQHRVELQRYVEQPYQGHNVTREWHSIATVWAMIEPVSGLTMLDTKQVNQGVTHKITIRWFPNLTSEYWVLFKSRRFRIRSIVSPYETKDWHVLLVEEDGFAIDEFEMGDEMGDPLAQLINPTDVVYAGLSLLDIEETDLLLLTDAFLILRE